MGLLSTINPFADESRMRHLLKEEPRLKALYYIRLFNMIAALVGIIISAIIVGPLNRPENYADFDASGIVVAMPLPALSWSFLYNLLNVTYVHFARKPLEPGCNIGWELCILGYVLTSAVFVWVFAGSLNSPWGAMMGAVGAMCCISFLLHGITWVWACRRVDTIRKGSKKEIIELRNQLDEERARNRAADVDLEPLPRASLPRTSKDAAPPPYAGRA